MPGRSRSLWRGSGPFWFWLAVYAGFGQLFGTVEVGALPWARAVHSGTAGAALGLTILSAAGIAVNLAVLNRAGASAERAERRAAMTLLGVMVLGCVGVALAPAWWMGALSLAVIRAAAVPLMGRASAGADRAIPPERQAEGFGILGTVQSGFYGLGGLLLAVLPIRWMVLSGTAVAIATLALVPVWERIVDQPAT